MSELPAPRRPHGELEAEVLAALWAAGRPLTPQDVQQALGGGLARTTVATILGRLHEKGTLLRTRAGRAYAYVPAVQDTAGLAARRMRSELDREPDRSTVLARFVSDLSADDERLLRELLGDSPEGGLPEGGSAGTGGTPAREEPA
ncbi:BlaI/MecI/CopY family transcriptional regulator [Streptacidiphilus sp. ASG 303]|uniref:BlaI/MecI/CopY family transcriptional regulator n=1 Tax=Streptacidiphilus sp. ASG 303 TaxID=2896847 RepID=UPI001E3BAC75|nr:BlaI/MecI/CopY family transcriptional regulator [Streptacidiphilus sp. ASG 303]MCD0483156.1 BlaI/MecI/CopY family transcriptional regulator [Streptacidiphilus sp. ASG 303]